MDRYGVGRRFVLDRNRDETFHLGGCTYGALNGALMPKSVAKVCLNTQIRDTTFATSESDLHPRKLLVPVAHRDWRFVFHLKLIARASRFANDISSHFWKEWSRRNKNNARNPRCYRIACQVFQKLRETAIDLRFVLAARNRSMTGKRETSERLAFVRRREKEKTRA